MGVRLDKLLSVAGPPLGPPVVAVPEVKGRLGSELVDMLSRVNGFYALESALHVLPSGAAPGAMDLQGWNAKDLWRQDYNSMAEGHLFFAEDVFGVQFSIKGEQVFLFDPETGEAEQRATSLEEWANQLLDDYEVLTGFPIAHEWQQQYGPLPPGKRLVPKRPFVLGGEFSLENLFILDAAEGMRFRAEVAAQTKDLPDGASVAFEVTD